MGTKKSRTDIWELGGKATKKKYGKEHYVQLGIKSGEARRNRALTTASRSRKLEA